MTVLLDPCVSTEVELARGILRQLPSECASIRNTWLRVGAALKGIHPDLYTLFDQWSKQSDNYGGTAEMWESLDGTGLGSLQSLAAQYGLQPESVPRKPVIKIGPDLDRLIPELEKVLARADNVYQRGGLVTLSSDVDPPPNSIVSSTSTKAVALRPQALPERLAQVADFERWSAQKKGYVPCAISQDLANQLAARGYWPTLPKLTGIVPSPVLLPNGSVLTEPGYNWQCGLYLDCGDHFPDLLSVAQSVDLLNDLIADFPFAEPCHRAAWIAMLLSLFGQFACGGNAPLFLIDANVCGCGKTLLVDAALAVFESRAAGKVGAPASDEEWRKLISTIAIQSWSYAVFDNVAGRFGSASFERALTTTRWQDRKLGSNTEIDVPLHVVWIATGNNAHLSSKDMARRTIHIRLETPLENPQLRTEFAHRNLLAYVRQHRTTLAMAALTILKAYHDAGRPNPLPEIGSFVEWSNLIRSAVVWAGWDDPCVSSQRLVEDDEGTQILRDLLNAWPKPCTSAEAVSLAAEDAKLRLAIESATGGKYSSQALGAFIRSARKRVIDGKRFVPGSSRKWHVEII